VETDRWQKIEQLYHSALERKADERRAYLQQACQGDESLLQEVESLLVHEQPTDEVLKKPIPQLAAKMLANMKSEDGTSPLVGRQLGSYQLLSLIGAGGMGEVFRAVDRRLGRAVAIKTTREQFSARFEREARAISSLNHPNICTLYDIGPNYLVMELVEGETLAARLKSGALPVKTALRYASQILAALVEAHEKGITHRDLKPGNIMIGKSGIKVLDFGLAKSDQDVTLTASHMVMGTPAYMAPEQREGKPADARSDIYSFGCVLYEMLTGARVGSRRRRVPSPKLERIVNRCLEEDPARRWQSAAELERELAAILVATSRGNRYAMAVALATLSVIGVGISGWLVFTHKTHALTDKDTIVLADFTNTTGDEVFDGALRQGLSVQLEQSPFLSIISEQQIQHALQMMGKKPDAKLTPETARELCQRTGSAAVLDGSIAQIGTQYLLTLKAVNCSSGETLASTEAQASDKNHVLDALGKTASDIRNKLGESIGTVQKFDTPLEQATTPSLEALKAFSMGLKLDITAGGDAAIPFLKHAIELDPKFALAYAWLGIESTDIGESGIAAGYSRKAYELRNQTSDSEKYFISAVFHKEATGNIEEAEQSCKLWIQAYPRAEMPHGYLSAAIYPVTGQYEKGVEEAREAVRLNPDSSFSYIFLMFDDIALSRLDEAKAAHEQALERKLNSPFYLMALYQIAFLRNDTAGMAQQVAQSAGKIEVEDKLLGLEADTAAYFGRLRNARELSRRAMDAAERSGEKEAAATYSALSALREALFGNADEARQRAALAMKHPAGHDVQYGSALALAYAGDDKGAQTLTDDLSKRFPEDTLEQFNYLPTLRARLALSRRNASEALESLRPDTTYELGQTAYSIYRWVGMYPVYVRGEAYLAAHQGNEAAAEFQKILDHRGIVVNEPVGALAHLQLGRAYVVQGDTAKAHAAYQDFLTLWKDADPDIPILKQAKAEYAKLQ